jgi:hypothetical protein
VLALHVLKYSALQDIAAMHIIEQAAPNINPKTKCKFSQ